jgi:hypothetical protein
MQRKLLLVAGIVSSIYYIELNIFIPFLFEGYDIASQTISELSAIGAPTRILWVVLAALYIVLFAAFGLGVLRSANGNRFIRISGILVIIYAVINVYWPPMQLRGNEPALTDTLHIVWASVTLLLMMLIMGSAMMGSSKKFRLYTIVTFAVFLVFGILTAMEAPGIPTNEPTPHIGIWERINIAAFMIWIIVYAKTLVARNKQAFLLQNGNNQFHTEHVV